MTPKNKLTNEIPSNYGIISKILTPLKKRREVFYYGLIIFFIYRLYHCFFYFCYSDGIAHSIRKRIDKKFTVFQNGIFAVI